MPARLATGDAAADPPEWIPIAQLYEHSPGKSPEACERWAQRRVRAIRRESGSRDARMNRSSGRAFWEVHVTAEWHDGQTAGELLAARLPAAPEEPAVKPPGWDQADDKDKQRSQATVNVNRGWKAIKREFPKLNDEERFPIFQERYREPMEAAGLKCDSLSTIYRYLRRTDPKNPSHDGNFDGRRQRGGVGSEASWSEEFKSYFLWVYLKVLRAERGTLNTAYRIAAGKALEEGWAYPKCYNTLRAWANRVAPEPLRAFYRNERRWQREHVESVRRDRSNYRPNELWSGDWHRCDFLVLHNARPVRPWLCVWEDMGTGLVVAWVLATRPNAESLVVSFGAGVLAWGGPLAMLIDNGLDFRAKGFTGGRRLNDEQVARLRSVCDELGTIPHFCWPFNPGSKPPESWFKTFCVRLSKLFPSYCGNKPENRPEHLYADMRAGRIDVPRLDQARAIVGEFIENVANNEPSSSLGGRAPRQAFEQDNPIPKRTAPEHVVRFKTLARTKVKVGRGGTVLLDGIKYGQASTALFKRRGDEVQVRYDTDRSRVFVCELGSRPICTAYNQRLTGATSDDVKELKRRQKAARKLCREALPARKFAEQDLSVQAMVRAQARYVEEQNKGRKAAGAESLFGRPLALLPGAAELSHQLPTPRPGGSGRKDSSGPSGALLSARDEEQRAEVRKDVELDWGDETPAAETPGDLLTRMEFDDE